jgi:hypothetical protein
MSGDNEHFIPRFLQKGFASKFISRKEVYVWYFPKKDAPRIENTKKVGAEFQFYGEELDDTITVKEDVYAKCLDRVRNDRIIHPRDKDTLIEFVYFQVVD